MIFNSIRWRLQAWHGLILLLVLTGFGIMAYHMAQEDQLRRIDEDLTQQLMQISRPPWHRGGPFRDRLMQERAQSDPGPQPFLNHESEPQAPSSREVNSPEQHPDGLGSHGPFSSPGAAQTPHQTPPAFQDFRETLRQNIQQLAVSEVAQTNTCYFILWHENGQLLARSAQAPAQVPAPRLPDAALQLGTAPTNQTAWGSGSSGRWERDMAPQARLRGQFREVYRFSPFGSCLLAGRSIAPDLAAMHQLALWLFIAGLGIWALGLAGGWWLASRAIRPINTISNTASRIAAGDLSQRIKAEDTDSELGRLAEVLNSTFARLEAAFAHQARFTSDASHELRTPVAVVLTQTQSALSRERSAAEYRDALAACQRAAQRMRSLSESLLQLARLDAGQETLHRTPFDLSQQTRECVELLRPLAAEHHIELLQEFPAPVACCGDAERITQVITNLLVNAIQFNHEGGQVRLWTNSTHGHAVLTVADTGEGIPPEHLAHIFERFYRVDTSRARNRGRTGLGLAISKAIVEAHGGSIEVSSQFGHGSSFVVRLPASA